MIDNAPTPGPPTKSFPTKSPRVKLSGRPPVRFHGHENSHPLRRIKSLLESNPLKSKLNVLNCYSHNQLSKNQTIVSGYTYFISNCICVAAGMSYMRNLLGWLETRLAQITLHYV